MFNPPAVPDQFKPETVPAPVGGLNAYDSLAAMPPSDCIIMQNWWPQPYGCSMRKGYVEWTTGLPSSVGTMAGWFGTDGTQKMFAWSAAGMYDISDRAVAGAAIVSGLSNSSWEFVTFTNTAGGNLIAVNGVDDGIIYKSTGVARLTLGDGIVVNTWAGLNPANAVQVTVHQRRLWAVKSNSTVGYYLPPDAVQGTFASFDFGPLFQRGGNLQFLTTWTLDDGNGAEDHLLAMSSRGEAVVFAGTNPSSSADWKLVGIYYVGSPVAGRRSFCKAGGDLLVLTQRGVTSMTQQLISTQVSMAEAPLTSKKIQFLISELITQYGALAGWQLLYHPTVNMLLINLPNVDVNGITQLAANQITQAWTQFTGMNAVSWVSHNDLLYFGNSTGTVYKAWSGFSDGVLLNDTGGAGVTATVQQAYSYFGGRSNIKQVGMYRPVFVTHGEVSYNSTIVYDFVEDTNVTIGSIPSLLGAYWNTALWGVGVWSGGSFVKQRWIQSQGMGVAASLKLVTQSLSDVLWIATDYSMVQGRGIL